MTIYLDVQTAVQATNLPSVSDFSKWAAAIPSGEERLTVCVRIVGEEEAKSLSNKYRSVNKATNVLSFPMELPKEIRMDLIGDVVICAPVVCNEAKIQNKNLKSHYAHMLIHGVLHLLGYDHENDNNAAKMENIEIETLKKFGINNPYKSLYEKP